MINYNTGAAGHYHIGIEEGDTEQLRRIIERHLPAAMTRFARKNRQYGENKFDRFGAAGQIPELWRKYKLLEDRLWTDRNKADFLDPVDEVIEDLIGHLLMLKDCLAIDRGAPERGGLSTERVVASTPTIDEELRWHFLPPAPGDSIGHAIREAKDGPETWTDVPLVEPRQRAPQNTGEEPPSAAGRRLVATGNHALRVAFRGEERCPWRYHAGKDDGMRNQCVGLAGHATARTEDVHGREDYHINADLEAWQV